MTQLIHSEQTFLNKLSYFPFKRESLVITFFQSFDGTYSSADHGEQIHKKEKQERNIMEKTFIRYVHLRLFFVRGDRVAEELLDIKIKHFSK